MLGYLSYLSGELLGLSGIVTLFCCAVAISHYALHNISAPARVTLVRSCQTLSYVSEGAIFIYVGMDTLDPLKWKVWPSPAAWLAQCQYMLCMIICHTIRAEAVSRFRWSAPLCWDETCSI